MAHLENGHDNQESEPQTEIPPSHAPQEPMRDIYVLFVREEEDESGQDIVNSSVSDLDTAPLRTKPASTTDTGIVFFGVFIILLCLFCIASQFYLMVNPFSVTVTVVAKSQQVSLTGILQLGRVLNPITLSQSQTVPTTGKGHQDARAATGFITFYNGLFSEQTVAAGTILTGSDGVQVTTDQVAKIPPANPPSLGQATVSAHAIVPGTKGNISTGDINQECCATALKAVNTSPFTGGQDERNFQTVAKRDIDNAAAPLKATLTQSVSGVLQGQVKQGEQLQPLPCSPTITSDHQVGDEATQVRVTASETCSALAYNAQVLTDNVTQLLTTQAAKKVGAGYSLLERPQITVTGATTAKQGMVSFTSVSTWVYGMSSQEQRHIKVIIAGKHTQQALQLLHSLPGIERASMQFAGFGDATRIPKNLSNIHLTIFYGL